MVSVPYVVSQRGGQIKQGNSIILPMFRQCVPFKIKVTQVTALQYYSCLTHLSYSSLYHFYIDN